jgi:hypothetical protein
MKLLLTFIARLSLILTVVPAFLYLFGLISLDAVKWIMAISCATWFISAPLLQREHGKTVESESSI